MDIWVIMESKLRHERRERRYKQSHFLTLCDNYIKGYPRQRVRRKSGSQEPEGCFPSQLKSEASQRLESLFYCLRQQMAATSDREIFLSIYPLKCNSLRSNVKAVMGNQANDK